MKNILLIIFAMVSNYAIADLNIKLTSEGSLPYDYSPSKYDNSPSKYENSLSNYNNSGSNYDNSESNYDNSSSNYDNGINGSRRLILNNQFYGYYVFSKSGVTNFYSSSGKRMFYNPKNTVAIFSGDSGEFSGVMATSNGEYSLFLTEYGYKILKLFQ